MLDSDIITRCPQCNTAFRVTENQLSVADGLVRCGSCLAVFKAILNQSSEADEPKSNSNNKEIKQSTKTEPPVESPNIDYDNDSDDLLISDEAETGLTLDEDVYDLDSSNQNKKTSLFDRQLKPISEHTKESADESWALDILADLENDDDSPIIIKRNASEQISPELENSDLTENKNAEETVKSPLTPPAPSTPPPPAPAKEEHSLSLDDTEIEEIDEDDVLLAFDNDSLEEEEQQQTNTTKEKKAFSFSFFKRKDKNIKEEPMEPEEDEFFFEEDEPLIEEIENEHQFAENELTRDDLDADNEIDELSDLHDPLFEGNEDQEDTLHFESDEDYLDSSDSIGDNDDNQDYYEPDATLNEFDNHSHISDEEIDSALNTDTSYAKESKDYLSRIQPAPVEMEWYESERTQQWLWTSGAILLGLLLAFQVAIFRFDTLAKNPNYRPYYQTACEVVGCQLPKLIDLSKIRATNLIVRSHPQQANALIIDTILINNANFAQPYPGLKLEFSDLNNNVVASRQLQPAEYLLGELIGANEMPVNQPIQLSLSIVDPGESAINYQLNVITANN